MDEEQALKLTSTLIAHEQLIQFLLINLLQRMSSSEREGTIQALKDHPGILAMPRGIAKDEDAADKLAGFAIAIPQEFRRIADVAIEQAVGRDFC